ncbi:MAG: glycosyltransferase family 39 protein [Chloroflexi bacterium]|nr:glycosyltransferase family 39 protein [Chloroflexota bacterium]
MPLFQPYFFASSDGLFHLYRLMEYDTVIRNGVLYPRWAPDFFLGLGMPLFNFYAPLTYYLAEIFRLLGASYIDSLKLLVTALMMASGLGAYAYARTLLSPIPSLLAGVFYMYAPYHIVNLYYRGDIAEYAAYVWYPLILWSLARLVERKRFLYMLVSAISIGALILTHNLSALIFSVFLVIYAVAMLIRQHGWRPTCWRDVAASFGRVAGAAVLAAGLTAFFWLPALAEKHLVDFDRLLVQFDFHEHFPTVEELLSTSLIHRYGVVFRSAEVFGYKLGALQAIFLIVGIGVLVWRYRRMTLGLRIECFASALVTATSFFFIFPVSNWVWENAPLLGLTQFPWRFLAFIALPSALMAGMTAQALAGRFRLVAVAVLVPVVIVSAVAGMFPVQSNVREADVSPRGSVEFELTYGAVGTSAAAEYLPKWVKERPATTPAALALVLREDTQALWGVATAGIEMKRLAATANRIVYSVSAQQAGTIVPNVVYYPGWVASVDGRNTELTVDDPTGLVKLAVPAGEHTIVLSFTETPLRLTSDVTSAFVLLVLLGLLCLDLRRRRVPPMRFRPLNLTAENLAKAGLVVALVPIWLVGKALYDSAYLPPQMHKLPLVMDMGYGIRTEGYDLVGVEWSEGSAVRVLPDTSFQVSIFWRMQDPLRAARIRPFVRLTNSFNQTWAYTESPVDYPNSQTGPEDVISTTLALDVQSGLAPGIYQVEVGFQSASTREPLEPRRVQVVPLLPGEKGARIGPIIVGRSPSPSATSGLDSPPFLANPANFGDSLSLLDLRLADGEAVRSGRPGGPLTTTSSSNTWHVRAGEVVHLDLLWQAARTLSDNYWVTARLVGHDRILWAVRDSPPADGIYPTSFWAKQEVVRDQLNLTVPPETPPGQYSLELEVVSRSGPLSVLDQNRVPIGPTLRIGNVAVSPSSKVAEAKKVKIQRRVDRAFYGDLSILGYALGRPELQPGDALTIELLWSVAKAARRDIATRLALVDSNEKAWGAVTGRPVGDAYPTSAWREGELLRGQYRLTLPGDVPEGEARLVIEALELAGHQPLARVDLARVRVLPRSRVFAASPNYALSNEFDGKIRLLGYDVVGPRVRRDGEVIVATPGNVLNVTPYWQALDQMATSYTVFVQVLNANGRLVAQNDSIPQGGKGPTTAWVSGEVIADEHPVSIPGDLPDGEYGIIAGIYDAATGKRLPVQSGGDFVTLTRFRLLSER